MYNWQIKNWADFVYNEEIISNNALRFAELSGEIFGVFKTFNSAKQQNEILEIMISEEIKTSAIEGEML
jgi:Fic family protein